MTGCSARAWRPKPPKKSPRGISASWWAHLKGEIATTPLAEVTANKKQLDPALFELAGVLAK